MNGMNDANQTHGPDGAVGERPVAFCQNCGRPLTSESKRAVGSAVYCEPCLEARLGGAAAGGTAAEDTVWQWGAGMPKGWTPGPGPNPGLAALLGLIPGVGAMYNEQYAKGIVHLVIFAVLVSFAHVTDVFVLFVLGWIAYMSIEAHHTARARRDGTPLPNPFGLNDIGERMGFGRAWPQSPDLGAVVRDAAAAAGFQQGPPHSGAGYGGAASARSGFGTGVPPGAAAAPAAAADPAAAAGASWGSPVDAYPGGAAYGPSASGAAYDWNNYAGPGVPGQAGYGQAGYGAGSSYGPGYGAQYGPGYAGYNTQNPYGPPIVAPMPPMPPVPPPVSRFPAGAVWLIGLGTIFLLGTTGIFHGFPGFALVGFALIGLGVWNFIRRMTETGLALEDDGTPLYRLRLVRAVRGAAWLVALGVLFLLDTFHIVRWEYSWPWLIILGGVLMLLKRAAYGAAAMPYYGAPVAPASDAPPASAGTGIVPAGPTAPLVSSELGKTSEFNRSDLNRSDLKQGGN